MINDTDRDVIYLNYAKTFDEVNSLHIQKLKMCMMIVMGGLAKNALRWVIKGILVKY